MFRPCRFAVLRERHVQPPHGDSSGRTATALAAAQKFFGPNFQPSESLKALAYFKDGDLATLTRDETSTLVKAASAVRDLPQLAILSTKLTAAIGSRGK